MKSTLLAAVASASAPTALAANIIVSHFSGPVITLDFQQTGADSGTLVESSRIENSCGVTPGWMHMDKEKNTAYCFDESWADNNAEGVGIGAITQYSVDANAKLTISGKGTTTGNSAHGGLYGGKDNRKFVATCEYTPGNMTTYALPITADTKMIQKIHFEGSGPHERQAGSHPHETLPDPTGNYVVVPDLGSDLVRVLRINHETGWLTQCSAGKSEAGDGPRHGLFHTTKDGKLVYYAVNELSSTVGVYDTAYGAVGDPNACLTLTLKQTIDMLPETVNANGNEVKAAELRIAGEFLYASSRGDKLFGAEAGNEKDSLAIYKIGCGGKLKFITLTSAHGFFPRFFDINKAEDLVVIGGMTTSSVAVVQRDTKTGLLGKLLARIVLPPIGTYLGEDGISSVAWWD